MFDTLYIDDNTNALKQYKYSIQQIKYESGNGFDTIITHLEKIEYTYKQRLNKDINRYRLLEILELEDDIKVYQDEYYPYEDISYCEECDDDCLSTDIQNLEDSFYCQSCYDDISRHCDDCGTSYHRDSDEINYYDCSDSDYCNSCRDNNISYCDDHEIEYSSNGSCEECENDEDNPIKNYSYRPSQLFLKKPHENTKLFYGIEIETVLRHNNKSLQDIALKTLNQFENNEVVLKSDSSIGDNGFEIVSNTATFEYHKSELWNCFFNSDIQDDLKSFHVKSCGLHIHASREFYSNADIGKIVLFLNLPYNTDFLTSLSGREYNSYCRHNPNKKITDYKSHERFEILNLTNNKTIEFRLFKGNLKRQSVFRYLEFVDSLSHFVKEIKLQTNNLKFWHYVKWVKNNPITKKKYNHLNSWLDKKGFYKILDNKIIFIKNDNVRLSK